MDTGALRREGTGLYTQQMQLSQPWWPAGEWKTVVKNEMSHTNKAVATYQSVLSLNATDFATCLRILSHAHGRGVCACTCE